MWACAERHNEDGSTFIIDLFPMRRSDTPKIRILFLGLTPSTTWYYVTDLILWQSIDAITSSIINLIQVDGNTHDRTKHNGFSIGKSKTISNGIFDEAKKKNTYIYVYIAHDRDHVTRKAHSHKNMRVPYIFDNFFSLICLVRSVNAYLLSRFIHSRTIKKRYAMMKA